MNALADVVFAITSKGFSTMRDNAATMNQDLRTVLTLVDGICPVAQYIPFLKTFAPLDAKFELLERTGLLRRVGVVSVSAVKKFEDSVNQGFAVSKLPSIDAEHEISGFVPLPMWS